MGEGKASVLVPYTRPALPPFFPPSSLRIMYSTCVVMLLMVVVLVMIKGISTSTLYHL